jgi:phosphatidylethanolamine-binding protein
MLSLSIVASFALIPLAAAQQNVNLELAAAKAHFEQSLLVPELIEAFNPTALITVNYPGVGHIAQGQALTGEQVGPAPTITVTAPSGTELDGNYTLAMVDPGAVGSDTSAGVTRHWLVNGLAIDGTALNNATAIAITEYAGPAPPPGTGPHRYAFLLYAQPATFAPPAEFSQPNIGVSAFDVNAYASGSGLGPIIAGTYITVQDGEATISIPPTSAVVTSTLSVASTSTSRGGSSTGRPSATTTTGANANGSSTLIASPLWVLAGFAMMILA